ncbi:cytochrome b/b6 domain-containing protein [uncultured Thioclava sp.]|uniref:cytochrome b/b6 domain-containing protein n=1 Tax=uncultured Thioclava sp. TaxID=473858 RepID=UPI0025FD3C72|nr:cytochrome b/b6 domain-containing protein [uncultured Thioclava sp.]
MAQKDAVFSEITALDRPGSRPDSDTKTQTSHRVWDPFVRLFHWSVAALFVANAFFTSPKHDLHHWIGYSIAGLVGARILWGVFGSRHARFRDFPPSAAGALSQLRDMATGRRHAHIGHSPLGALMIYNLLVTLLVIAGSGWLMTTDAYWGVKWPKDLHEIAVNWAEFSIAAHIAAVIYESLRLRVNLARAMITGRKDFRRDER